MRLFRNIALALGACAVLAAPEVAAQQFPSKPVRILVPFTTGGGVDSIARLIAQRMSASVGQTVLVENRVGAGGAIGSEATAHSAPDGYTMLLATDAHVMIPNLQTVAWDPVKDFAAITGLGTYNLVLAVTPTSSIMTVQDLIAQAKANPGKLSYSSAGIGSATHIAFEAFKAVAKIDVVHVPYRGLNESLAAGVSGETPLGINGIGAVPSVKDGKLRGLGVTGSKRWAVLPDLPRVAELGVPDYTFEGWFGIIAPAGVPAAIVTKLNDEILKAVSSPEVKANLINLGFEPQTMSPKEFGDRIAADTAKYKTLIKAMGISVAK
jgi:tripartite-type tricarboxylate transporter receptor subunit TctC